MPDEVAKGFGISVSLDAAGAEGAKPCATQPPQTHTRLLYTNTTQRSAAGCSHTAIMTHKPPYFVGFRVTVGLGMGLGFGSSRNLLAVQVHR